MSTEYIANGTDLKSVADAIRAKTGKSDPLTFPTEFASAIAGIETGGAGSIDMQVSGGYIQYSTDSGTTWENLIAVADLKGEPGKDGEPGEKGAPGTDGAPGKDGAGMDITGAAAGQIAKISAVDENGVPTAWTPADMPSGGGGEWVLAGSVTAESAGTVLKVSNIHAKHILVSLYASCDETSSRSYQIKLNDAVSAMRGSALPGNGEKHLWAVEFELLTAGDENYIYCRIWPNEGHHTNNSGDPVTTMYTTTTDGTMWYKTSISEFNSVTFQSGNGTPSAGNIMNVWYR